MEISQPNPEEVTMEGTYTVPVPLMKSIISYAESTVCILQTAPRGDICGIQGSAGLYEHESMLWAFITNHHIVQFTDIEFITNIHITFELRGGFSLKIRAEYIEFVSTSPNLDATIIGITKEFMLKLRHLGVNFLKAKPAVAKERIALISYPKGEFSIDKGEIESVEGFTLSYDVAGDKGSSGAPILAWDFCAVGIHKSRSNNPRQGTLRYGTALQNIIEFHISKILPFLKYLSLFYIKNLYSSCTHTILYKYSV